MSRSEKAVVLLSGGLDSAVLAAYLAKEGYTLYGLSFDYGQRSSAEISCARTIAAERGFLAHWVQTIGLHLWGGSSLVDPSLALPTGSLPVDGVVSNTYVPGRNTVFLSFALSCAESVGASVIFIAAHVIDYGNYPDCRPNYFRAYNNLIREAVLQEVPPMVEAPFINFSKSDIIVLGQALGVDFSKTVSCYQATDDGRACGVCSSCLLRRRAFHRAGVHDSTRYCDLS